MYGISFLILLTSLNLCLKYAHVYTFYSGAIDGASALPISFVNSFIVTGFLSFAYFSSHNPYSSSSLYTIIIPIIWKNWLYTFFFIILRLSSNYWKYPDKFFPLKFEFDFFIFIFKDERSTYFFFYMHTCFCCTFLFYYIIKINYITSKYIFGPLTLESYIRPCFY